MITVLLFFPISTNAKFSNEVLRCLENKILHDCGDLQIFIAPQIYSELGMEEGQYKDLSMKEIIVALEASFEETGTYLYNSISASDFIICGDNSLRLDMGFKWNGQNIEGLCPKVENTYIAETHGDFSPDTAGEDNEIKTEIKINNNNLITEAIVGIIIGVNILFIWYFIQRWLNKKVAK